MKTQTIAVALLALCIAMPATAVVTPWTQVVWNDGTSDVASTKTALQTAEHDSVLVSFIAGGIEYTSFILSDSNNLGAAVYDYGQSATDPGSANAALADDRIDSLTMNNSGAGDGAEFYFSAAPADINGVLFLCDFREFSSQRVEFQLLDSSGGPIGAVVTTTATHWEIGKVAMLQTTSELSDFRGVAIPLTDFGINDATVIGGVRLNEGAPLHHRDHGPRGTGRHANGRCGRGSDDS